MTNTITASERSVSRLQDQLYLDPEYWSKLVAEAKKRDQSVNRLASLAIEDWLEAKLGWPLGSGKRWRL